MNTLNVDIDDASLSSWAEIRACCEGGWHARRNDEMSTKSLKPGATSCPTPVMTTLKRSPLAVGSVQS